MGPPGAVSGSGPPSRIRVALVVVFHSSSAILSTLVSKAALNSLDAPVLLLALQTTVQVILLTAIGIPMGWVKPWKSFATWRGILPLTIARLTGILAKTFCLAAVDAAFYQVARGLLLPFTLLLSLVVLQPRPYFPPLSVVGAGTVLLGFGAGIGTDFGQHLTAFKGLALGVGSSFTTAVESVVVKRYLSPAKKDALEDGSADGADEEELGMWQMVWMSNVLAVVFYIPLLIVSGNMSTLVGLFSPHAVDSAAASEAATAAAGIAGRAVGSNLAFLPLAFLTGLVGFLLTIATFMQIEVTSPTTHMIVSASRGVAQSSLAGIVLRERITSGRASSMALILGGSALYGWAKDRQMASSRDGAYSQLATDESGSWNEGDLEKAGRMDNGSVHAPLMMEESSNWRDRDAEQTADADVTSVETPLMLDERQSVERPMG